MVSNGNDDIKKEKELEQYGVWVKAGPEEIETEDTLHKEEDFSLHDIDSTAGDAITEEEENLLGELEKELVTKGADDELDDLDFGLEAEESFDMPLDIESSETSETFEESPEITKETETAGIGDEPEMDTLEEDDLELEDIELADLDDLDSALEDLELEDIDDSKTSTEPEIEGVSETAEPPELDSVDDFDLDLDEDDLLSSSLDEDFEDLDVDSFLKDDENLLDEEETALPGEVEEISEAEELDIEELPDLEISEDEKNSSDVPGDFSADFDETESIIEDLTATEEDDAVGSEFLPEAADEVSVESASEVLKKIENELLTIKNEILTMKEELSTLRTGDAAPAAVSQTAELLEEESDFFNEDDDETIALTGDELDNILNTADITEEQAIETESLENAEELSPDEEVPEAESQDLIDQPDIVDELSLEEEIPEVEEIELNELEETEEIQEDVFSEEVDFEDEPDLELESLELDDVSELNLDTEDDDLIDLEILDEAAEETPELIDIEDIDEDEEEEPVELSLDSDLPNLEIPEEELSLDSDITDLETPEEMDNSEEAGEMVEEQFVENLPELSDLDEEIDVLPPEEPSEPMESTAIDIEIPELQDDDSISSPIELPEEIPADEVQEDVMEIAESAEELSGEPPVAPEGIPGEEPIPTHLQSEVISVLSYMDQLLESLPEEKIEEFANSEYFSVYKKLFDELGLH